MEIRNEGKVLWLDVFEAGFGLGDGGKGEVVLKCNDKASGGLRPQS
jgi:hypothetical protein